MAEQTRKHAKLGFYAFVPLVGVQNTSVQYGTTLSTQVLNKKARYTLQCRMRQKRVQVWQENKDHVKEVDDAKRDDTTAEAEEQERKKAIVANLVPNVPEAVVGQSVGKDAGKMVGSSLGSSIGSGVGIALGSMAGAVLGKAFGKSVGMEASAARIQLGDATPQEIVARSVAKEQSGARRLWNAFLVMFGFRASASQLSGIERLKKYGVAAFISYGLFDAITYSLSFLLALKSFTAKTGKPLSWGTFPQVFALMWGINNFSRPFRIAGALLISPFVDQFIVQPVRKLTTRKTLN